MSCEIYQEIADIIQNFSLSIDEIDQMYLSEGITNKSLKKQIMDLEKQLDALTNQYVGLEPRDGFKEVSPESYERLRNELIEKRKQLKDELTNLEENLFSVGVGKRIKSRNYPSDELRNKVFYGTIKLAKFYAKRYLKLTALQHKYSYDDLFQIASEALLSACYYYVPNGEANFFTYASCCIRNHLNKEVFPKKKKRTKDFFTEEKEKMLPIEEFLSLHLSLQKEDLNTARFMRKFRRWVCSYNYDMLSIGQPSAVFSIGNRKADADERYRLLIIKLSKMLSTSKLPLLIDNDNRWIISQSASDNNVSLRNLDVWTLFEYLKIYVRKLDDIEAYLSIVGEIDEEGLEGEFFYSEVLRRLNEKVHEFNSRVYRLRNKTVVSLIPRISYYQEYFEMYGVNFLYNESFDCGISRAEEIEDIRNEMAQQLAELKGCSFDELNQEELQKLVDEELARRKRLVLESLNEKNQPIYAVNRDRLEDKKCISKPYRRKYGMQDILTIEEDISILYRGDESIFDRSSVGRSSSLSVEEQVEVQLFLDDYHQALEKLSPIQRDVLNLWFDSRGIHSMSSQEISSVLGISPKKVYREKEKALRLLRQSPTLSNYRDM